MTAEALALLLFGLGFMAFAFGMARRRRTTAKEALENAVRKGLWDRILRRPGIQQKELYAEVDQPRGTILYHLGILRRAKALQVVHVGGVTRYFPADTPPVVIRQYSLLLRGRVLEFAREVIAKPGIGQDALFHTKRLSRKVLWVYVPKLVDEGLLRVERGLRTKYFHPTDELRRLVARIDEGGESGEPSK